MKSIMATFATNSDDYAGSERNPSDRWKDSGAVSLQNREPGRPPLGDRGYIGVLAAELADTYTAYREHGEKVAQEECARKLIGIAKRDGFYLPPAAENLEKYLDPTRESRVYFDSRNNKVLKLKDPFALLAMKGASVPNVLFEHLAHNLLFESVPYHFRGVTEDEMGNLRFVLEQPLVHGLSNASEEEVSAYFKERGFEPSKKQKYTYTNGAVSITDVMGDNVIVDENHRLHFIDPVIRFEADPKIALTTLENMKKEILRRGERKGLAEVGKNKQRRKFRFKL
ncbi:MAG: hypothetical protein NC048_02550 [Bacteroides sp.]|nr:hypothetical protein [Bacteroides sp.]MCM1531481.1 hypothetical protein [Ruminococcus flavefaciens]MCM1554357.1 hypothetical protein [Bacteroides sp.]